MEKLWKVPIKIQMPAGDWVQVEGPDAAMQFINEKWPSIPGPLCQKAIRQCFHCLRSDAPSDESRKPFVAAAIEAGLTFL
jgi:hypothetical protein